MMEDQINDIILMARLGEPVPGLGNVTRRSMEMQLIERLATQVYILNAELEKLSELVCPSVS